MKRGDRIFPRRAKRRETDAKSTKPTIALFFFTAAFVHLTMLQSTPAFTVLRPPVSHRRPSSFHRRATLRPPSLYPHWRFSFFRVSVPPVSSSHFHSNRRAILSHPALFSLPPSRDISICRQQASSTIPSFLEPPTIGTMRDAFLWLKFSDAGSLFWCVMANEVRRTRVCVRRRGERIPGESERRNLRRTRLSECRVTRCRSCRGEKFEDNFYEQSRALFVIYVFSREIRRWLF